MKHQLERLVATSPVGLPNQMMLACSCGEASEWVTLNAPKDVQKIIDWGTKHVAIEKWKEENGK